MIINWYGESCFKIQVSETTILTDPLESSSGLTPPRFKADATLFTKTPMPEYQPLIEHRIYGPGEYEIKGIEITGMQLLGKSGELKSAYLMKADEMKLCFLGHIAELPDSSIKEKLTEIDILFIPAGGDPFLPQEIAAKLIKQIQPKIVIPTLFKIPALKRASDDVKKFLRELEQKAEPQEKLTIKKKDLPENMTVVVLKT